ncbi:MAG: acyl-CoA dehydrogenase family protein, partial [candidate division Zixibacteria bacterium]|nr:acyl-CoA dehydrogenase family protein [candidate division Zixibacteria bacterium]
MDFQLTEEALEFKEMAKEFAEKRLYPNALEIDEKSEMPDEIIKECAELGYFGFTVPEEYGGLGLSATSFMGVIEEFSAACAGFTILLSVEGSLIVDILMKYGTEEQRQKYLPGIASGEAFGAYCLTEPDAGTDAGALKTIAEDKGDHYLMNGTKSFISHAHLSKMFIVFAKTDPEKGSRGISCFIVDADSDGISLGAPEKKCGMKASETREINFADVKVPKENLLGELNAGFKMALTILSSGRLGISFQSIGIARASLEESIKYSKERKQFNQPLSNFQALQFKMAEMATRIDAGRLLAYRAVQLKDEGKPFTLEASMAKLFCSQTANYVVNEAVQIHGGYGYMKEYPVERYFRDARIT